MARDEEIALWIDERWKAALEAQLKDESLSKFFLAIGISLRLRIKAFLRFRLHGDFYIVSIHY